MSTATINMENKPSLRASHCEDEGRRNLKQSHPLVPELRFKEFEVSWTKKDFGTIVEKAKAKHDPQKSKEEYPCIEMESIAKESSIILELFNSKDQLSIKNKFSKGEVLFGKLRPNLKKYVIAPFDGVCSSEIWVLKGKELSNEFLFRLIQTNKFYSSTLVTSGSKMPRADWAYISSSIFPFPSLPEQQKIASFLSAVDEKIQQLTKKKALLEQYKKGVMQELFSGQLRFKDEKGKDYPDWEEKRLGDIAIFLKGKGISKIDLVEGGDTPCIRYGELYTKYSETIYEVKSRTNIPLKDLVLSELDDVIIPASGETQIDIATASCVRKEKIALGGDLNVIRSSSDGVFLAYYLNNALKHSIARLSQGSSVMHLYSSQLKTLKLSVPPKVEQQKIATYLSGIDTKIESVNSQITQTQTFKKGLLQQMFV
jgi:type I restriction enzyme S subunit